MLTDVIHVTLDDLHDEYRTCPQHGRDAVLLVATQRGITVGCAEGRCRLDTYAEGRMNPGPRKHYEVA